MSDPVVTSGFVGAIGLALDITGAFFLASSFVMKRMREVARDNGDFFDGNPFLLRSACYQAIEARSGFVFLFLGFTGEFLAETSLFHNGPTRYPWETLAGGAAVLLMARVVVRRLGKRYSQGIVSISLRDAIEYHFGLLSQPQRRKAAAVDLQFYGEAFDLKREPHDTAETYGKRLVDLAARRAPGGRDALRYPWVENPLP